jgi:nitrate reductase molybdenum cofactor assembly chaperone NarJ/NarW
MKSADMIVLRALGALLAYPSPALREALPEIEAAIAAAPLIGVKDRQALLGLIELLRDSDPLWSEERYVELFDRGRATSLHLFEHVHGEARDRGEAMVELKSLYERGGFALTANELPDYLPVVLEYLSCRDLAETRDMLGDCAHILRRIGEALLQRQSAYAAVFASLLAIAGQDGLDTKAAAQRSAEPEDLDQDWEEQPAFATPTHAPSEGSRS